MKRQERRQLIRNEVVALKELLKEITGDLNMDRRCEDGRYLEQIDRHGYEIIESAIHLRRLAQA